MSWTYHLTNQYGSMTQAEMEGNVDEIYAQLYSVYGWSVNAICGLLGNLQQESSINPAQVQHGYSLNTITGGYGLAQWTPASKIKNWLRNNNHSLYSGFWQLYCLNFESYGQEYYPTSAYPITYAQFKVSGESVEYLTKAFLKNYERAGDEAIAQRVSYAEDWYRYIMGEEPPEPSPTPPVPPDPPSPPDPDPSRYERKTNISLYLRNRNLYF